MSNKPEVVSPDTGTEYLLFKGDDANFLDVEFEFIKGNIFSQKVQNKICNWANEHKDKQYLSIFLALEDQRQNFVMGMNMPDEVYDKEVNVFIRQDRSDNFVTNLRNEDLKKAEDTFVYSVVNEKGEFNQEVRNARYANIYPFGMNETAYCADEHSLKRAKLLNYLYSTANYNTYKFQSILSLDAVSEERIWSEATEHWRGLSVALKWSNLYSAYAIRTKMETLRALRKLNIDDRSHDYDPLSDNEIEMLAKLEHNRWNTEKNMTAEGDIERFFKKMPNKRYVHVIRRLILEDWEPERLAQEMNITTANLYNIKRRAMTQLTQVALKDIKEDLWQETRRRQQEAS